MRPIESSAELYAHAIALEREAAERYAQFAQRMKDEGRDDLAALFGTLARQEGEHLETLERRTEGVALPELRGSQYKWLDSGPPDDAHADISATGSISALRPRAAWMKPASSPRLK